MTWSKVLSYFINWIVTLLILGVGEAYAVDAKILAGGYTGFIILHMFITDLLAKIDDGTALCKSLKECSALKEKKSRYERASVEAHHLAVKCLSQKLKGTALNYELTSIVTVLSDVFMAEGVNEPKAFKPSKTEPHINTNAITSFLEE